MPGSKFVYVTYIRTTEEKLWSALTDAEEIRKYWFGVRCDTRWTVRSPWRLVYPDGTLTDAGEILEAEPPRRLVIRWQHQRRPELKAEGESRLTMELGSSGPAVRLTLTHSIAREQSQFIAAVAIAWPMVIANLKSLLETGSVVLQEHYPADAAIPASGSYLPK
ncbi:MAG TPA: SRPBCC family protein [Bacteroidota bacterium]|nr:SRPBCC family protein [Bacteroidota bacterium]